ncbi:MAG: winged helix-turn-helix domain-containing protein [Candidatus Omnitrophica bacterium]|nr:winged helix-turn-helix domain-containing protein [Candidatus Omnitrophota bacterium]MBU1925785.1 winged helix-turn-helix domain-containing protein [Candidatus Omnitrophota bacterium]MBU2063308.1 winged helix-turn-helix domain-containing protein [Candidatus Omnitrophota bacterium]
MIMKIGIIAGDIWHYLDANGTVRLSRLLAAVNKPRDLVLMSLGWLAREGHVKLEGEDDYTVCLRK